MPRHRVAVMRGGWRMCLYGFAYYLCAVIVLENILAVVYWNISIVPDAESNSVDAEPLRLNAPNSSRFDASVGSILASSRAEIVTTRKPEIAHQNSTTSTTTTAAKIPAVSSRAPTLEELEKSFYRVRDARVNPYLYDFTLKPETLCDDSTFMIILIHSHHPNKERRAAIRKTWGSVTRNGSWPNLGWSIEEKMKLVFVLGTHKDAGLNDLIREEWRQHDDIVQGSFYDSYQNMTLKSLLGLKLVTQHCPRAKYLLKNDDDMFINVPYLVSVLRNRTLTRAIMGPLNVGSKVYRNGKWKLSRQDFPFDRYPPYESGAAYLITCDLVRELFETAEYVPSIFIDDVYITGILGKILNVTHERQQGFAYWTNRAPSACDIVENRIISGTKMTPALLLSTWQQLRWGPVCKTNSQKLPPKST